MNESGIANQIETLKSKAISELESVSSVEALDEWRVSFLGRRGELTQLLRGIGSLPTEDRPAAGAAANALRQALEDAMAVGRGVAQAGRV